VSLRARAATWTALAVVVTALVVIVAARQAAEASLVAAVDDDLRAIAMFAPGAVAEGRTGPGASLTELRGMGRGRGPHGGRLAGAEGVVTILDADGRPRQGVADIPVSDGARAVARGDVGQVIETFEVEGERVRVLTIRLSGDGGAVQLVRSLGEVDDALRRLTTRLVLIGTLATLLAAVAAVIVAERVSRPVRELTDAAEDVARTHQLTTRIAPEGDDELARLGQAFDAMLASLDDARRAQTQLVADASHELRTPLTSLRTNIDLLRSDATLPPDEHRRLLDDLGDQLVEFGALVDGLVELARGERPPASVDRLRLEELVAEVTEQTRRDHPNATLTLSLTPTMVVGERDRLARAVRNLLVNAIVHGGGEVDVTVRPGAIEVRDHGPGIAEADRERALARFYRAPEARSRPGSGLGLAIVDQVARTHGGEVALHPAEGGGTVAVLTLPEVDLTAASR
jgi:two-component system, OmpR family, sensor histidine kinase MprB